MFTVPQFLSRGQHRNDLLNPVNRGTMQAVRGMKNAPRPCRRKTSARAGSVSDHRTYHTLLWTTRKQHGQRGPKMKWSGAETAKNGRKYSKKVSGACSHCRGRRFESDQVHQNWKSPWFLPRRFPRLTTVIPQTDLCFDNRKGIPCLKGMPFLLVYSPVKSEGCTCQVKVDTKKRNL